MAAFDDTVRPEAPGAAKLIAIGTKVIALDFSYEARLDYWRTVGWLDSLAGTFGAPPVSAAKQLPATPQTVGQALVDAGNTMKAAESATPGVMHAAMGIDWKTLLKMLLQLLANMG